MLHFRMCNSLKFTQNSLRSTYDIFAYLFTAMVCDELLCHIAVICVMLMFSVLIKQPIVLRYSTHIKPRKTIKNIKPLITPPPVGGRGFLFSIDFFLSLFVYLFVWPIFLSATLRENGWTDLHEIFREGVE